LDGGSLSPRDDQLNEHAPVSRGMLVQIPF
jgi:hypothetical protein